MFHYTIQCYIMTFKLLESCVVCSLNAAFLASLEKRPFISVGLTWLNVSLK